MSILVMGASHRTAPVEMLERLAFEPAVTRKLLTSVLDSPHVTEALVLATCNRIEVYAEVDRFHGSVEDLTTLLAEHADLTTEELLPSLYVHYDEAAVAHLFSIVTGLDSMVVGESQILGQVREAFRHAQAEESVGASLNTLFQQGLRVGKRAHSETGIDHAGQSVVSVALAQVAEIIGPLEGVRVCIVGAGSIAALAATSVRRAGIGELTLASRTLSKAQSLASAVGAKTVSLDQLGEELVGADLLISCTGAAGTVVAAEVVAAAMTRRGAETPMAIVDLAMPHDVAPEVADLPGVTLIALKTLAESVHNGTALDDVTAVKAIVDEEVTAFLTARDASRVAPTVVALRRMATAVVAVELERLWGRSEELTQLQRDEIAQTVRRVAEKLLYEPTVRVKQLVGRTPESTYADALAELFALDPAAVEAVLKPGEPV